jgi:tetratricopeptide (TPR) repeat protein
LYKLFLIFFVLILISCTNDSDPVDYMKRAMEHGNNFRYDSSLYYLTLAEKYFDDNDDYMGLIKVYNGLGKVYSETGNFLLSKEYFTKSLEISEEINALKWKMHILSNLGDTERSLGNYDESSKYLMSALFMSKNINNDSSFTCKLFNNLGNLYFDNNQVDSAQKYYMLAYDLSKKLGIRNKNFLLNNIGGLYNKLGIVDSSEYYYKLSIKEAFLNNDTLNIINSMYNLNKNFEYKNDNNVIFDFYHNASSHYVKGTSAFLLYKITKDDDIERAYFFLSESIKYYEKSGDFQGLISSIKYIISLTERLNKDKERKKYIQLLFKKIDEISTKNIDNIRNIELAEKQHHIEIMKKNLELKDKELQKARYFKIGTVIFFLFSLTLIIVIIKLKKTSNEKIQILNNFSDFLKKQEEYMNNLTFDSTNNTFSWDLEPNAVKYRIKISINGGGFSTLYEGTDTNCELNLTFGCEVEAKGQTEKDKQTGAYSWGPDTDCIDNPISYTP